MGEVLGLRASVTPRGLIDHVVLALRSSSIVGIEKGAVAQVRTHGVWG